MKLFRCPVCRYGFGRKYDVALGLGHLQAPTVTCPRCTSSLRVRPRAYALATIVVLIGIGTRFAQNSMPEIDIPFAMVAYLLIALFFAAAMLSNSLEVIERADPKRLGYRAFGARVSS